MGVSGSSGMGEGGGGALSDTGADISWLSSGSLPNSSIGISSLRGERYFE
jgi:hypothetical protein